MRARTSKRAPRLRAIVAVAAVAVTAGLLALRAERGTARAEAAVPATPAARETVAAEQPPQTQAAAAAPTAPAAQPPRAQAPASEEELMERVRVEVDENPEAAIALAEQGEAQFPSGRYSDERAYLRMRALVHVGEIGVARDAAREFFERHPDSPLGRLVFRLTGMRPAPVLGPRS